MWQEWLKKVQEEFDAWLADQQKKRDEEAECDARELCRQQDVSERWYVELQRRWQVRENTAQSTTFFSR